MDLNSCLYCCKKFIDNNKKPIDNETESNDSKSNHTKTQDNSNENDENGSDYEDDENLINDFLNITPKNKKGRPRKYLTEEERKNFANSSWYCDICKTRINYRINGKWFHLRTKKHIKNSESKKNSSQIAQNLINDFKDNMEKN